MTYLDRYLNRLTPSQKEAVLSQGNTLLSAGAGAGKTGTLIARCLHWILNPVSPHTVDRILVVTFTEAAAAEMKSRLHSALVEAWKADPTQPFIQEQLALLDVANIGTLHGFCLRLIREHYVWLDMDPGAAVLSSEESSLLKKACMDKVFHKGYQDEDEAFYELLDIFGNGSEIPIAKMILKLHEHLETIPESDIWFEGQMAHLNEETAWAWDELFKEVLLHWGQEWQERMAHIEPENNNAHQCAAQLATLKKDLNPWQIQAILQFILDADTSGWTKGKKTIQRKKIEKLFDETTFLISLLSDCQDSHDTPLPAIQEDWTWSRGPLLHLMRMTESFRKEYARAKNQQGAIDFHDIEQFALKLLSMESGSGEGSILGTIKERFDLICVDEYQDINPVQDRVLSLISHENEKGNRFLVGDVKQSIYRFRQADPSLLQGYRALWGDPAHAGHVVDLQDNFRSHPDILDFVNKTFEHLFHPKAGGIQFGPESRLVCGCPQAWVPVKEGGFSGARIELILRCSSQDDANNDDEQRDESEIEARCIARKFKEIIQSDLKIPSEDHPAGRSLTWNDMVILHRSPKNKVAAFQREFQREGVPLRVSSEDTLDNIAIRDWINLLKLLDNPLQDLPLVAILRSPIAGMTLNELATIRLQQKRGPFWKAAEIFVEQSNPESNPITESPWLASTRAKLLEFNEKYRRWRSMAQWLPVSRCLEIMIAESGYTQWLDNQPDANAMRSALRCLVKWSRKFDKTQRQGLARFLQFLELKSGGDPESSDIANSNENAVRLLSVHKSKGLEFPVVCLAGLDKRFNLDDLKSSLVLDAHLGLCPRVSPPHAAGKYPSLPHWIASRKLRLELVGEESRLLYVAMTRASHKLVLSGSLQRSTLEKLEEARNPLFGFQRLFQANHCLDLLLPAMALAYSGLNLASNGSLPENAFSWSVLGPDDWATDSTSEPETLDPIPAPPDDPECLQKANWIYPYKEATLQAAKSSVSSLRKGYLIQDETQVLNHSIEETTRFRKKEGQPIKAIDLGKAWHSVMQYMDLSKAQDTSSVRAEINGLMDSGIIHADEASEIRPEILAEFWSTHPGVDFLKQETCLHREMPFTCRIDSHSLMDMGLIPIQPNLDESILIQGVIDLAMIGREEIWILDFKTDHLANETMLTEKSNSYKSQLHIYKHALEKIYRRPVTRSYLYFLRYSKPITVTEAFSQ